MSSYFACVVFIFVIILKSINSSQPQYCVPSNSSCWPTQTEITDFSTTISGTLLTRNSTQYPLYINMTQNLYHRNQYPSFIILCKTVRDIQKSILFSSFHNIQISIMSTGHSYSGRSTANFSFQINLSQMRNYKIGINNNSITVESGLEWGSIYGIISYYNKIVVGVWDPSVGPVGSAMGGGHSPFTTAFGFVADHIIEAYLVDSNANIIHIYNTSGNNQTIDDLFWSIRGGGAGTFGVIVNITFELLDIIQNAVITSIGCIYQFYEHPIEQKHFILDVIFNNYFDLIKSGKFDKKWGGLAIAFAGSHMWEFEFLYYGDPVFAKQNAEPLLYLAYPYNNSINTQCSFTEYQTFGEFEATIKPDTGGRFERMANVMVSQTNLTKQLTDQLIGFLNSSLNTTELTGGSEGVSFFPTGGVTQDKSDDFNALHPAFRHTFMEMNIWSNWYTFNVSDISIYQMNEWETKLRSFGYPAIYSNEEEYDCDCNWKQLYWGNKHYQTLLKVKKIWDPNQVFWCNHCVGDGDY